MLLSGTVEILYFDSFGGFLYLAGAYTMLVTLAL